MKMKKKIGLGIAAVVIVVLALVFFIPEKQHEDDSHTHESDFKTFGPGLGPHSLTISLMQFDKVKDIAKKPDDLPAHINRDKPANVKISLTAKEVVSEIAPGIEYLYWTFDETVPGPFLRVREGDTVELSLLNHHSSSHNHSIDLHAVNGPGGGATLTQVAPGEEKAIKFKALNPGLYVYHCATPNVPTHIANGMYGLILVEPEEGLPEVDKEFYAMQGELYTKGHIGEEGYQPFSSEKMLAEHPDYVVFNGRVKAMADHPAKADVGDEVRLFVGNGGVSLVSSFHVIGEIFDTVYPEASSLKMENVQTTTIPAGGAAITEFKMDVPGNYVLVDHALSRLDKGAWGILTAEGKDDPSIYSEVKSND